MHTRNSQGIANALQEATACNEGKAFFLYIEVQVSKLLVQEYLALLLMVS